MLPRKPGVMVGWTLDLFFARDIEQMITLRDVEALGDLGRSRARRGTTSCNCSLFSSRIRDSLSTQMTRMQIVDLGIRTAYSTPKKP
jgi:hypothetical protein